MQIISPPSGIKSIQRGSALINSGASSINVVVASVNLSKSFVSSSFRTYVPNVGNSDLSSLACSARLSSGVQLVVERASTVGTSYVEWELVEYA